VFLLSTQLEHILLAGGRESPSRRCCSERGVSGKRPKANTEVRKKELFSKVRSGQVRVLLGSTQKMGAGTNVQDLLVALHDLDCPWRPGDLAQRKGRIERQGNQNPLVHVYRYVTEGTFDAYLWVRHAVAQINRLAQTKPAVPSAVA
jgi:SNF2 family DNA or RNA helicase